MKKPTYIKHSNLPPQGTFMTPLVYWRLLEHFSAPGWGLWRRMEEMTSGDKDRADVPDGGGWILWSPTADSEWPVDPKSRVLVRLANGDERRGAANCFRWNIGATNGRTVVAYKLI